MTSSAARIRERRRFPRYTTYLDAAFRPAESDTIHRSSVINLSAGGLLLSSRVMLTRESSVHLWIGRGEESIELEARVVGCDSVWDGYRVRAAFTFGQALDIRRLEELLERLREEMDGARLRRGRKPALPRSVGSAAVSAARWDRAR